MDVRRVTREDWEALRETRLRALADAPDAFGTTYAEALERPEQWWIDWCDRSADGDAQAMFLAWVDDRPVGIAGVWVAEGRHQIISMWTDPAQRGQGVGTALLDAAASWSRARAARTIQLSVVDGNDAARRLYERYGFVDTGESEPLRSNPASTIRELRLG